MSPPGVPLKNDARATPGKSIIFSWKTQIKLKKIDKNVLNKKIGIFVFSKVLRDAVGYGFVVRGSMPVYVQTVDPNGPGAAAGIKVGAWRWL